MPSRRLRRTALTAAALAAPVGWVARAAWGLPVRARCAPPPAAPHRGRLAAVLRRQVPQHDRDPGPGAGQHPRRACCGRCTRSGTTACPVRPIPLARAEIPAEAAELAVTWFGHASALLEVDGRRVLVDPVWGDRVSPSPVFGPTRLHPAPIALDELPPVDAVAHLARPLRPPRPADRPGAAARPRRRRSSCRSASASTCASWGVPEERIVELDWNEPHDRRRADADLHRGAALLRSLLLPRHHALGVVGDRRPAAPGVLRRRHRLHPGVRRDRRAARPVRPDAAAGRRLQRRLARHPHGPGGGGARARRPRRPGAAADPLGHVQPRLPPLGRAGAAGCCAAAERARRATSSSRCRASGSTCCDPPELDGLVDGGRLGRRPPGGTCDAGVGSAALRPRPGPRACTRD